MLAIVRFPSTYLRRFITNFVASSAAMTQGTRRAALRAVGTELGGGVWIEAGATMSRPDLVAVGPSTFLGYRCILEGQAPIRIGANCDVAAGATFVSSTHEIGDAGRRAGPVTSKPITVGDGVWIGARATVTAGVTIGDGCVIGAGAVVVADCEPHSVYVGVPARKLRSLQA